MGKIQVREVTPEDVESCCEIESTCFEPSEAASQIKIVNRSKIYPEGFLIAEIDGRIVGHVNSAATNQDDISKEEFKDLVGHEPDGQNIVIFSLAVLPSNQGQGISSILLKSFIERSRELRKSKILLLCKSNLLKYYQKFGFQDLGLSASTHGGFDWHEMALKL